jgi:hypothetical protein
MQEQKHFERDDILGNWYPTDCVIALISADDAEKAITALRQAGFDGDKLRHWQSQEMLDMIADKENEGGIKGLFRNLQRDLTDDAGALNVYEQGAKYGQDVLAAYAPNEEARQAAHQILSANFANHIKYYGAFAVTDLS